MNGTFTETCMYAGAALGAFVALYFEMSWWGLVVVFAAAFVGAAIGAGIKAAWIIRRSGGKLTPEEQKALGVDQKRLRTGCDRDAR